MKEIRNHTTHRPITDVCRFQMTGDIHEVRSISTHSNEDTVFLLHQDISANPSIMLFDFVKEVYEGVELFVEDLYFYLRQAIRQSGSLPIY